MATSPQNTLALRLRALHQPGTPLLLTNIWDAISASSIAALPTTSALASASFAVAASHGLDDDDLPLDLNLASIRAIGRIAQKHNIPLTVDFQDGYAERLEEGVREVIAAGAVGVNLEDYGREIGGLYDVDVAVERIKRVMRVAAEEGVPDFVVNARSDVLLYGGSVDEAIKRGKRYLEAGAWNVFVWGGGKRGGITRGEVQRLSEAFGGRLNVSLKRKGAGGLSVRELGEMGVARISVGPGLMGKVVGRVGEEAERIARGEYE
ncbi:PEP phosphonomutase-like protein [Westerdykella ornata]|uniref:PEP phosphonomutase-like protein n=1 Tax=Westerdykella ornata TaxID=318751 RepID=A0A6A6JFZ2_WESOR|nr:PEP phosphonomutase-like protein [Westerdykella ornata]KAF2275550.1 PEP phosphonomutase-like protein [Westerdykella ornata]